MGGSSAGVPEDGARRRQVLDAALSVFLKFGFRKTSMDEVARAASMSRQGLYLHFESKEALFEAVVHHALGSALTSASARLGDPSHSIAERLVGAFDEWVGRYVGAPGAGISELGEASHAKILRLIRQHEDRFVDVLARFIRSSGLLAAYKPVGLTARQLAEILNATARGFKHESSTREAFVEGMSRATRALCLPLESRA